MKYNAEAERARRKDARISMKVAGRLVRSWGWDVETSMGLHEAPDVRWNKTQTMKEN